LVQGRFHLGREGPGWRLAATQHSEITFYKQFHRHFSLRPSVVIEIGSTSRSTYLAGDDGNRAILRKMPLTEEESLAG